MTHDEAIALIQAQKDGKTVQTLDCGKWYDVHGFVQLVHSIHFDDLLRIKPEPITVRGWVNVLKYNYGVLHLSGCFDTRDSATECRYYDATIIDTFEVVREVEG